MKNMLSAIDKDSPATVVFLDTETTGLTAQDVIIEIAMIKCQVYQGKCEVIDTYDQYIRPLQFVPKKIEELTGITNEFLIDKPLESEVFQNIDSFLGECPVIAAYNAKFDAGMIERMYQRNHKAFKPGAIVDVLEFAKCAYSSADVRNRAYQKKKLDEKVGKTLSPHCLTVAAFMSGVKTDDIEFHNALADTTVTIRLYEALYSKLVKLLHRPSGEPVSVYGANYYEGFKGKSKLYIITEFGSIEYDTYDKVFYEKDFDISNIDLEFVIAQLKYRFKADNMDEIVKKAKEAK